MADFILKGYTHSIYTPRGLKEFLSKAYYIPGAKENEKYRKIYTGILVGVDKFEKAYRDKINIIKNQFEEGEKYRYSNQFIYITRVNQGKKYESDFDALLSLGELTDKIIEDVCNAVSKINNSGIKKEYTELINPIRKLRAEHPAKKVAEEIYKDYLAIKETKELVHHFLKRDTVTRSGEDVNLGTTLYGGKEIKLPLDNKLTNNNTLAMHKSGNWYYVKINGKILKYNNEGKKIGEIAQGSFGDKNIKKIEQELKETWGL